MKPIIFEPILIEKVWGGTWLKRLLKNCIYDKVGEAIIFGENNNCYNDNVKWDAKIKQVYFNSKHSPLMIKLLDAREDLSVQVHPLKGEKIKTEAWYVLEAEKNAHIVYGLKDEFSKFKEALIHNKDINRFLKKVKVEAGDFIFLPSGIVHALGKGIKVLEIQQNSDVTYRLYDYGRNREIHVQEGLNSIDRMINYTPPQIHKKVEIQKFIIDSYKIRLVKSNHLLDLNIDCWDFSIIVNMENELLLFFRDEQYILPPYSTAITKELPLNLDGFTGKEIIFLISRT